MHSCFHFAFKGKTQLTRNMCPGYQIKLQYFLKHIPYGQHVLRLKPEKFEMDGNWCSIFHQWRWIIERTVWVTVETEKLYSSRLSQELFLQYVTRVWSVNEARGGCRVENHGKSLIRRWCRFKSKISLSILNGALLGHYTLQSSFPNLQMVYFQLLFTNTTGWIRMVYFLCLFSALRGCT